MMGIQLQFKSIFRYLLHPFRITEKLIIPGLHLTEHFSFSNTHTLTKKKIIKRTWGQACCQCFSAKYVNCFQVLQYMKKTGKKTAIRIFLIIVKFLNHTLWFSEIVLWLLKTDLTPNPLKAHLNEVMLIIEVKDFSICLCIGKLQLNLLSCQQLFADKQMYQLEKQYKARNTKAEIQQR